MAQDFDTREFGDPPPPLEPAPRRSNVPLIIAIVVLVVLCCCCLIILGGAWLWNNGDLLLEDWGFYGSLIRLLA